MTFTIDSSVVGCVGILLLRALPASTRASSFYLRFWLPCVLRRVGPQRALWASIQVGGPRGGTGGGISGFGLQCNLRASTPASVFDALLGFYACFELFTRASSYARFGGYHHHRLVGAAKEPRAGTGTGRGRAPEPGVDERYPAAALPGLPL